MPGDQERRKHTRLPVAYEYLASYRDKTFSGLTRDASPYGAGILSDQPFEPNSRIDIKIYIASVNLNIEAKGVVVYCIEDPKKSAPASPYLAGIKFTEGPLEDLSAMDPKKRASHYAPSHTLTINADARSCYHLLADFESYPEWAGGVKEARVLERYPDGRGRRVEFLHDFFLRQILYVLDYAYDDQNYILSWESAGGDEEIIGITGSYQFSKKGENITFATYKLEVTLSIVPSQRLVQYVTKVLMRKEMKNFKNFVEKNAG